MGGRHLLLLAFFVVTVAAHILPQVQGTDVEHELAGVASVEQCLVEARRNATAFSGAAACAASKERFGLCTGEAPRECLIARVPWRTPLPGVQCCFECCMQTWEHKLGLGRLSAAWQTLENKTEPAIHDVSFHPELQGHYYSHVRVNRKELGKELVFLEDELRDKGVEVEELPRGGMLCNRDSLLLDRHATPRVVSMLKNDPVTLYNVGDKNLVVNKLTSEVPVFTNNAAPDAALSPTLRVRLTPLDLHAGFRDLITQIDIANTNRTNDFMCCCMTDRGGRSPRAREFQKYGLCTTYKHNKKTAINRYVDTMVHSRIVWSPMGHAIRCFRDLEALYAGAAIMLDSLRGKTAASQASQLSGFPGSDKSSDFTYFSHKVPVIWLPGHGKDLQYEMDIDFSVDWMEAQYAKILEADKNGALDLAEIYWPYWFYHMTRDMPVMLQDVPSLTLAPSFRPALPRHNAH